MATYDLRELSTGMRASSRAIRWIGLAGLGIGVVGGIVVAITNSQQHMWNGSGFTVLGLVILIGCGFGVVAFGKLALPPPETLEIDSHGVRFYSGGAIAQQFSWEDSMFRFWLNYTDGARDPVSKGHPAAMSSFGWRRAGAVIPVPAYEEILKEAQSHDLRVEPQGERNGWRQTIVRRK